MLTISMTVASLYIFVDLVNTQMLYDHQAHVDLLSGPVYAFGTLLKYMCQMLVTQYVTPKAYDRVFITIGRISRLVGYAAMFASLSLLIN